MSGSDQAVLYTDINMMTENYMKVLKHIFTIVLFIGISSLVQAQSAADLELAKQLAKQQGYSDAQIEAMMKQKQGSGTQQTNTKQASRDRNAGVEQMQEDLKSQQTNNKISEQNLQSSQELQSQQFEINKKSLIFGHNIFNNKNLNFVPNYNLPTPDSYKLSAADEVVVDIWGDVITNITTEITPDGAVIIPDLGPVYLAGKTITQAEKSLKEYLSKIYSGISAPNPNTFVKLSLGKIRSVTVNVVGDVKKPGTYTLPSLSTIASAMYLAEGVSDLGTVRNINLYRNNKLISTFDIYDFITKGNLGTNLRLEDNDVISVAPYYGVVTVLGGAKRPMKYEISEGESLSKLVEYMGGFTEDAYDNEVVIDRKYNSGDTKGATSSSFIVNRKDFGTFSLENGDIIYIKRHSPEFANRVKIVGAVRRPGIYGISIDSDEPNSNLSTLRELILKSGGLKEDAYMHKGYIVRFGENRNKEQVTFSPIDVILKKTDVQLMPDDSVRIFSVNDIMPKQTVQIYGEVNKPSDIKDPITGNATEYEFRHGMTIGDLILNANGITDAATLSKVEIARRIGRNGEQVNKGDTIAKIMHFNIMANPQDIDFQLEPYDIVFVRKSKNYKPQQAVAVAGEVLYPGTYVIEKNTVRLSDVIKKSQGFNSDAYVQGAKLTRTLTKEEYDRLQLAMKIAKKQVKDTTAIDSLEIGQRYDIAIDLLEAMKNPGSYADVVLREGDIINVPKINNTVKISGAVLYPNTVAFNPKKGWKYYLSNAGGTLQTALSRKIYMVHMNGSVAAKGDDDFKVYPGTEIVVPSKIPNQNKAQNVSMIMGIATSTASLAAMIITIINQAK